jgi:hypothetical protein
MSIIFQDDFGNYTGNLLLAEYSWLLLAFRRTRGSFLGKARISRLLWLWKRSFGLFIACGTASLGMLWFLGKGHI